MGQASQLPLAAFAIWSKDKTAWILGLLRNLAANRFPLRRIAL
jgi:hypothetical protein